MQVTPPLAPASPVVALGEQACAGACQAPDIPVSFAFTPTLGSGNAPAPPSAQHASPSSPRPSGGGGGPRGPPRRGSGSSDRSTATPQAKAAPKPCRFNVRAAVIGAFTALRGVPSRVFKVSGNTKQTQQCATTTPDNHQSRRALRVKNRNEQPQAASQSQAQPQTQLAEQPEPAQTAPDARTLESIDISNLPPDALQGIADGLNDALAHAYNANGDLLSAEQRFGVIRTMFERLAPDNQFQLAQQVRTLRNRCCQCAVLRQCVLTLLHPLHCYGDVELT